MRDFSGIASPQVFTLHDLVHRLTLRSGNTSSPTIQAKLVRAVQDAMRKLPKLTDWNYFKRQTRFNSSASSTVTVTYDHAGGSQPRLLTITAGDAWPQDATYGEIWSEDKTYRISRRISDVQATLEEDFSLSSDFTGEVTWQRRGYHFGREITKMHYLQNVTQGRMVPFTPTSSFMSGNYHVGRGGACCFTWQNHGNYFGTSELILSPAPATSEMFEASATVNPHIPKVVLVSGTDAIVTQGSQTVSSAGASFSSNLLGTIFRLSRDATAPINYDGDNWEFQAFVTAVTTTTLTLSEPSTVSGSARGYSISSPIDIDTSVMLEHLEDEAYFQYTKNHDHKSLPVARQVALESLRPALASNSRVSMDGPLWDHSGYAMRYGFAGLYCLYTSEESSTGTTTVNESTYYLTELPADTVGEDGDQTYITSGDLQGAIYEKQAGVWSYIGIYQLAMRSTDPSTASLPTGFQWRLANQAISENNGIWEWDGVNVLQRVAE